MKRGPFEVTESKIVYKNPWIEVREDKVVQPNGKDGIFGTIVAGEGSTILALTGDNQVYFVREFHYAQNQTGLELPSGGINSDENPEEAAKRELKEETGISARKWTSLGFVNPLTVVLSAPNHMFLAEDLIEGKMSEEEKELIKVEKIPFNQVLEMIEKEEVTHAASVTAILKVARIKGL